MEFTPPNDVSLGRTETNPAQDCRDVMDNGPGATSGKYYVKTRSSKPFQVYCDMDTDGGGWTLFLNYHWNKDDLPKDRSKEEGVPTSYLGAFVDFNPAKKGFEQKHLKQLRYLSNSGSSASPTTRTRRSVSSTSAPAASPSPKSPPPRQIRNSPKTWTSTRRRTRTGQRASLRPTPARSSRTSSRSTNRYFNKFQVMAMTFNVGKKSGKTPRINDFTSNVFTVKGKNVWHIGFSDNFNCGEKESEGMNKNAMFHVLTLIKVYFKGEAISKDELMIRYKEKMAKERENAM